MTHDATPLDCFEERLLQALLVQVEHNREHAIATEPRSGTHRARNAGGKTAILAACGVLIAGSAVAATALNTSDDDTIPEAKWAVTTAVASVPEPLASWFSIFHDVPANEDPPGTAKGSSTAGLSSALSRSVSTSAGTVRVMPGDDVICMQIARGDLSGPSAGTCGTFKRAHEGRLVMRPDAKTIAGLAADGVETVRINDADGKQLIEVPVTHNVWVARQGTELPDRLEAVLLPAAGSAERPATVPIT